MIVPWPPQFPHVFAIEKNPCWKRICPVPRHCGQARGAVPRRVPRPPHCSQGLSRGSEIVRSRPRAARPEEVPEEVAEDVLEARGEVEAGPDAPRLECGVAEAVVLRAPLGVGEHLVGFADLLEALLRLAPRLGVPVGVPLERELAVGLLDLLLGRGTGDAQHLVVVALHRGRGPLLLPASRRAQLGRAPPSTPSLPRIPPRRRPPCPSRLPAPRRRPAATSPPLPWSPWRTWPRRACARRG